MRARVEMVEIYVWEQLLTDSSFKTLAYNSFRSCTYDVKLIQIMYPLSDIAITHVELSTSQFNIAH